MESKLIERVLENWFKEVSSDFPPELRDDIRKRIKGYITAILSGEDPESVVEKVDEEFIERMIRESGSRPEDVIRRMELLAKELSKHKEFEVVAENFAKFVLAFLKKMLRVYERLLSEEAESRRRVERVLRVLGRTNQAITRIGDEKELLKEVCRIIVEEGGYAYVWVGYAEEDKSVRVVATAGKGDYAHAIKVTWDYGDTGQGPTGMAIRTGKAYVVRDIEKDGSFEVWKEEALKRGFRSSVSLPLRVNGKVTGALNIYASEKDAFDEEELSLLEELADSISYAIYSLRSRKKREELEKLYELTVENTGTAILVIESERIIFANKKAEELSGFSRNELMGKPFTILLPEKDRNEILKIHKLRLAKPELAPNEYEIKYADRHGRVGYAIVTASVIPGTKRVVVSLIDITQRKDLEKKLRESEERYKAIFEKSPLGIVLSSVDMTILDCNDAVLKMVGMRKEDVIGRKWTELNIFDPDKLAELMREFYRGLSGEFKEMDLEIKVDGNVRYLRVFPVLLKKEGIPYAFVNILEDVTDKKIAETQLKDALERIQILRSIDLGIIEGKNIRDLLSDLVKALKQKVGCDILAIRVLGDNGFTVSYPEIGESMVKSVDAEKEVVVNLLEKDSLSEFEVELLKAGMVRYAIIPLVARGDKLGVILAASRESKEKDVEFLRMIAGQLAIAVHEALLFEAKRKAYEQIEQNIEQFAILVDHIRNPLAAAQGFVEIYVDNEEAKTKIKEQLDRIVELVEQLEKGWVKSEAISEYLRRERENRGDGIEQT
ncbi:MAG: PAS domain S-box protein [Archaeoglobus sp.]|uniref:PAS domain S-box protein n=1 Tax=Archaeoglobus sp. TaxID=1872626 RepID=UPI001D95C2EE|nr:PAS domain S-box protein [Archaeoglobus sp.]MBO8180244.1 PAS domain S-box protein [Archaeoglobus sp.]